MATIESTRSPAAPSIAAEGPGRFGDAGDRRLHPLLGTRLGSWIRVTRRYARSIPWRHWRRMAVISMISVFGTPVRAFEAMRLRSRIRELPPPAPVFIIGHWRSGTTNFHNHMLQDPRFGYVSLLHCLFSPSYLTLERFFRWFMKDRLPTTRPMDSIAVGLDEPMSEDFAMACLSEFTHYHRYFFPESNDEIFRRTILFEGVSDREIEAWYSHYDALLRKVMVTSGVERLVLKNPPHTGRIRQLLKYYPDAKFVHVYRNPYHVIESTRKLMSRFLGRFAFQNYDPAVVEQNVLEDYARLMRRFFADEPLIPKENYIQLRHEDIVADGVSATRSVYEQLNLPGYEEMRPRLERYVDSISDYKTNRYEFGAETLNRIEEHCGFAIDRWGYERPA